VDELPFTFPPSPCRKTARNYRWSRLPLSVALIVDANFNRSGRPIGRPILRRSGNDFPPHFLHFHALFDLARLDPILPFAFTRHPMTSSYDVVVFFGSLRKESFTRKIANSLAKLAPDTLKVQTSSLATGISFFKIRQTSKSTPPADC